MLILVPFAAFAVTLIGAFLLVRSGRQEMLFSVASALVLAAGVAFWKESATAGVDVLIYTAFLWGVALPAGLALLLGAGIGHWERA